MLLWLMNMGFAGGGVVAAPRRITRLFKHITRHMVYRRSSS